MSSQDNGSDVFDFMLCNPTAWRASRMFRPFYALRSELAKLAKLSYAQLRSIVRGVKYPSLYCCLSEAATMRAAATSFSPFRGSQRGARCPGCSRPHTLSKAQSQFAFLRQCRVCRCDTRPRLLRVCVYTAHIQPPAISTKPVICRAD